MAKEKKISKDKLMELYSTHLLENNEAPKNVFLFAKENKFEEKEFYSFFSSLHQLEGEILVTLFNRTLLLSEDILSDSEMSVKEKMLNVYFIFFENLTLNRSLILLLLDKKNQNLLGLKVAYKEFIDSLDFVDWDLLEQAKEKIKEFNSKSRKEILWLHMLSCIEFWKKDQSSNFEKTDIFIEKTIDTGFDLIDSEPLKKVIDLGKFMWKERFN